jgi:Tfp pilus assembly protein PilF
LKPLLQHVPRSRRGIFFSALLALPAAAAVAAPYQPADDAQVLARVPPPLLRNAADLSDPAQAARLAQAYIEQARQIGDPRWLGYAESLLAPWWQQPEPPSPVLLLRATLRQSRHEFTSALADLDVLLRRDPRNAQAWLTRATILRVQGRYAEARQSCLRTLGLTDDFVTSLCAASVSGLAGSLRPALKSLESLETASALRSPELVAWYWAERTEMLERLGDVGRADAAYVHALKRAPQDLGLRAAYADFLLDQRRPAEALQWARQNTADDAVDALRLRRVLAAQALGQPDAKLREQLADAFAAARRRGEDPHLREEARYLLEVERDAPRALALAVENWATQREPMDARLLLAAAQAAGKPQAAQPVRQWLKETGYEDARLAPLLAPAGAAP